MSWQGVLHYGDYNLVSVDGLGITIDIAIDSGVTGTCSIPSIINNDTINGGTWTATGGYTGMYFYATYNNTIANATIIANAIPAIDEEDGPYGSTTGVV